MSNNRMTIRTNGDKCQVFKLKPQQIGGYATDMAAKRFAWHVSGAAVARFTGSYDECMAYIETASATFMTEHGIPC